MSDREACYKEEGQCLRGRILEMKLQSAFIKTTLLWAGASDKEKAPDKSITFRLRSYVVVTV